MNDYKLINKLLKDGSEQSLLKLKMIVDFPSIVDVTEIKKKYRFLFITTFKEYYSEIFSKNPWFIGYFPTKIRFEIAQIFKEKLYVGFLRMQNDTPPWTNRFLYYFVGKEMAKVKEMFPDIKFSL